MKKEMNPELNPGDRIVLYYMEGESSVPMGTQGEVANIGPDPFDRDVKLIYVRWDNGSTLSMLSNTDKWKLASPKKIEEQDNSVGGKSEYDFFGQNEELFDLFDWRFLRTYLKAVQKSGIVNMFGASPLLYCGSEHIERYYGEDREEDESLTDVLEMADEAKDKMVQGTIKWMEANNKEVSIDNANRYVRKLASKMLSLFMHFY